MADLVGLAYAITGILIIVVPFIIVGIILLVLINLMTGNDLGKLGLLAAIVYAFKKCLSKGG